ncbi:putative Integral membrane protein pth11 [Seiridium unicorne]|uniref:Integral membrane protein pth11 n=1 Tax=Seiridium unicorne TaxID=138068 RepID=A0ABR2UKU8_9PEZI
MPYGGTAPSAITAMWILTALTFVFVILRIYTRIWVVHSYGIDDHVYNLAFLFLLIYVVFITISGYFGFGQSMEEIQILDNVVHAVLFEAIGQTFAVVGMAIAKWSLGLFLLRLVTNTWHKVAIWTAMSVLMGASISVCFVFWLQCSPPAYLWDKRVEGGRCEVNSTPVSMLLCILCVLVDFFFALFPWLFIWNLQMNKREKLVILVSMSLGVIAGACGIKRTLEVPELSSVNYLKDTVGLIVWSAAEIAVTMICIGIPICRPLYKTFLEKLTSQLSGTFSRGNHGNRRGYHHRRNSGAYQLHTIGNTEVDCKPSSHANSTLDLESGEATDQTRVYSEQTEMDGATEHTGTKTFAISAGRRPSDEGSDEEILGLSAGRVETARHGRGYGIKVVEEYQVTSSLRRHK